MRPVLLTVRETQKILRIHRPKVYQLIRQGTIEGIRVGSDWRVKTDSLERLIGPIPNEVFEHIKHIEV